MSSTLAARVLEQHAEPRTLDALRGATRSRHLALENLTAMLHLMSAAVTQADYAGYVSRLLGFYEPLEEALREAIGSAELFADAAKSRLIARDLVSVGVTAAQLRALPRCSSLPAITRAGALGAFYVTEGATLGGRIIARRLRSTLDTPNEFLFLECYGSGTGSHWKTFCAVLDGADPRDVPAICATAVATFDAFAAWFSNGV